MPLLQPNTDSPLVIMGRVAAAHGVRGWIKVQPFTEYLDSLLDYPVWWIAASENATWREVKVVQTEAHHKTLAALLPDCPDRTAAEKLKGWLIAVPRASLPEPDADEYYWSDLIGSTVVNLEGVTFGQVINLMETGANDVLLIKGEHGDVLIPFVKAVVGQVDLKLKTIQVDWQLDE